MRDALGLLPKLKVIARSSSGGVAWRRCCRAVRKLGVGHLLTGSIRRSPSLIRVSAQLVDGRDGAEQWRRVTTARPAKRCQ